MPDEALQATIRGARAEEQWLRYDTICIGPGASRVHQSWFEDFQDFANADSLTWNDGTRTRQVGLAYCNQSGDTEDWAQRIYQSGVDFLAPPGILGSEAQVAEAAVLPELFLRELPEMLAMFVNMQDLDDVLLLPGSHLPGVTGVTGATFNGAGFLIADAGQRGTADMRNSWSWPEPLEVAAKSKLVVRARIDQPIRPFYQQLNGVPGVKTVTVNIPSDEGPSIARQIEYRNWYRIRVWHRGPRFVQMRGARSA